MVGQQAKKEVTNGKKCSIIPRKRPCYAWPKIPNELPLLPSTEIMEKLKLGYEKLQGSNSGSLLRKYLTRMRFDTLKYKVTPQGSNLLDVVQSGYKFMDSEVGVYAADCDSYDVFFPLFYPIIADYHKVDFNHVQSPLDWGNSKSIASLKNLDTGGKVVRFTRVHCCRSIQGLPLSAKMMPEHYKQMEDDVIRALETLGGVHKGKYETLASIPPARQTKLIEDHYLFKEGDRFLIASRACDHWPTGRGIFMNQNKTFLVWVGYEDHLRIISMQMDDNLGEVYQRLIDGVKKLEKVLTFRRHPRFQYITFSPTNLGTGIRATVMLYLPKLGKNMKDLEELGDNHNLLVRAPSGIREFSPESLYMISNKRCLGLTAYEAVYETYCGVKEIIQVELERKTIAKRSIFLRKSLRRSTTAPSMKSVQISMTPTQRSSMTSTSAYTMSKSSYTSTETSTVTDKTSLTRTETSRTTSKTSSTSTETSMTTDETSLTHTEDSRTTSTSSLTPTESITAKTKTS